MGKIYSLPEIRRTLPVRSSYLMLDRAEVRDDGRAIGWKNVTINERFFIGHFPKHPIMPGVLQLEAMKQLCELVARPALNPEGGQDVYLKIASKVKFRRPVFPGDRVKVEVEPVPNAAEPTFKATCSTAGGATSEAVLTMGARPCVMPAEMPADFDGIDRRDDFPMNVTQLMDLMPHRFPFLLVDYVAKIDGENVIAVKEVSGNEVFFDQERDYQVLPEAVLCEIGAQGGCACVLSRPENAGKIAYFMSIDRAESFAPVFPGDRLVIDLILPPAKSKFGKGSCIMKVGEKKVFAFSMMFALVDA